MIPAVQRAMEGFLARQLGPRECVTLPVESLNSRGLDVEGLLEFVSEYRNLPLDLRRFSVALTGKGDDESLFITRNGACVSPEVN